MKKAFSIILIVLAISSLFGSLIILSVLSSMHSPASSMEGMYYMNHYSWIFWLFMLVPLGCLLFGVLSKFKRNWIIGIIFSGLLFAYGCFYLVGLTTYSTDASYIEKVEAELELALPKERTCITQSWTDGKQTSTDGIFYKYQSVVRFQSAAEIDAFVSSLDATKWCAEKEQIKDIIPAVSDIETNACEYFLLYCYETKSFSETVAIPQYHYTFMAFDQDGSVLYVTEFVRN